MFTESFNLKSPGLSRTSSTSESESEWRSPSIICQNPTSKLPVISEGKEVDLEISEFENEYKASEFGPDKDMESECIVKVNLMADDAM